MTYTPTPGVVARWTSRHRPPAGSACDECGTTLTDTTCNRCGQLAGRLVGMLATVVDTPAGPQLVIAERTVRGDWTPIRTFAATREAVRAISRPGATGPSQPATPAIGGLW
jgi:hypothetical protein